MQYYEEQINQLEIENIRLNKNYDDSYDATYWLKNKINVYDLKDITNHRQGLVDKLCVNYDWIDNYKFKLDKQKSIFKLLSDCYWFIQNSCILV